MHATRPLTVFALLLLAGCGNSQASSIPGWQAPANYAFTLDSTCGERTLIGKFHVAVMDGSVVDAEGLNESGRAMLEHGFADEVPTLTELLGEAQAAVEDGAQVVDVKTTGDGRPTQIDIDWDTNAIDDEACYSITDFTENVEGSDLSAGQASATVYAPTVVGDGTEVTFGIDICERPLLDFTVEETSEEVRVHAITTDEEDPADCALETTVTLDEPLGERTVVDVGSGETLAPQVYDTTE